MLGRDRGPGLPITLGRHCLQSLKLRASYTPPTQILTEDLTKRNTKIWEMVTTEIKPDKGT